MQQTPTPEELRGLLAHLLAGAVGGTEAKWRCLIGEVAVLPLAFHPRSNWKVEPTGTTVEQDAIEKAVQHVREAYPYVSKQSTTRA